MTVDLPAPFLPVRKFTSPTSISSLSKYSQLISSIFFSFFIGVLLLSQHSRRLVQSLRGNGVRMVGRMAKRQSA